MYSKLTFLLTQKKGMKAYLNTQRSLWAAKVCEFIQILSRLTCNQTGSHASQYKIKNPKIKQLVYILSKII